MPSSSGPSPGVPTVLLSVLLSIGYPDLKIESIVFNNIVGYPGGRFWSSFVFNNIVGCTFILSYRLSPFPAADNPGSPATETTRLWEAAKQVAEKVSRRGLNSI